MNIIKRGKKLCLVAIGLCVILSLSSIGAPLGAVCLYSSLAAISIVFSIATLFALRRERGEYEHGVSLMHVGWVFLAFPISLGLLTTGEFYRAPNANLIVAMVSQGVLAIVGLYIMVTVNRILRVPFAP